MGNSIREMRLFTGLTVATAVNAQCSLDQEPSSGCPDGWTAGTTKCYKFVLKKLALSQALSECKTLGGDVFQPASRQQYDEVVGLGKSLGVQARNSYWMSYRLDDTKSTTFPPVAVKLNGEAGPEWIGEKSAAPLYGQVPSGTKVSSWIRSGRNRRFNFNLLKINKGKINLTRKGHRSFFAAAMCEMEIPKLSIGDPEFCWQPTSDHYNSVEYNGKQSRTNTGYDCANWNDESVYEHKTKPENANHNYCRNPDNGPGGPWCYVNELGLDGQPDDSLKWDYCPIDKCSAGCEKNEFTAAQADCGNRYVNKQNLIIMYRTFINRMLTTNVYLVVPTITFQALIQLERANYRWT